MDAAMSGELQRPLVSIIVPVYNVEGYLDECMGHLVSQTYENIEIILVDDGSTDQSGTMCDTWALEDSRIRVVHQPNQGLSMARNNGLQKAAGQYVTYVDSDDCCESNLVARLLEAVTASKADVGLCAYTRFDSIAHTDEFCAIPAIESGNLEQLAANMVHGFIPPSAWAKLYTKRFADIAYFDKGALFEDAKMWGRVFGEVDDLTFCSINEPLYHYRISNSTSIMLTFHESKEMDIIKTWETMCVAVSDRFGERMNPHVKSCRIWMWFEVLDRAIRHGEANRHDYCDDAVRYLRSHKEDVYSSDILSKRRKVGMRILAFSKPLYIAYRRWILK